MKKIKFLRKGSCKVNVLFGWLLSCLFSLLQHVKENALSLSATVNVLHWVLNILCR